ncbi:hypothetical protein FACS1894216_13470 [Synergistales bacterium]|nr:hypothetical protein FACS1894216_13470 [Synergistales bacterium]
MFNFYRFLADIPDDVVLDDSLIYRAQHGAVLLAASGVFAHEPPKPANMDNAFYEEGFASTTSSNISYRSGTNYNTTKIDSALSGQMDDEDPSNIDMVGHRRWILNYELKKTAFGVADIGDRRYFTIQVFDGSRSATNYPDYILWPNQSAFPLNFFKGNVPWSIQLHRDIYAEPTSQEVAVILTRVSDAKTWIFTKNDTDKSGKYFNLLPSHPLYCIVFRPDGIGSYSGAYDISVSGLKLIDGSPATLNYTVEFFDIRGDNGESSGGGGCSTLGMGFGVLALAVGTLLKKRG